MFFVLPNLVACSETNPVRNWSVLTDLLGVAKLNRQSLVGSHACFFLSQISFLFLYCEISLIGDSLYNNAPCQSTTMLPTIERSHGNSKNTLRRYIKRLRRIPARTRLTVVGIASSLFLLYLLLSLFASSQTSTTDGKKEQQDQSASIQSVDTKKHFDPFEVIYENYY